MSDLNADLVAIARYVADAFVLLDQSRRRLIGRTAKKRDLQTIGERIICTVSGLLIKYQIALARDLEQISCRLQTAESRYSEEIDEIADRLRCALDASAAALASSGCSVPRSLGIDRADPSDVEAM